MTNRKARRLHIKLWTWLAETGAIYKTNWPDAEKYGLEYTTNECYLCEAKEDNSYFVTCKYCPLYKEQGCVCSNDSSLYGKWRSAKTKRTRKKYAALIVEAVKNNRFGG